MAEWICTRCMSPADAERCPKCGALAFRPARLKGALPPETILAGRYLVGGAVGGGGFGITYRARDLKSPDTFAPVAIKEFFPRNLAGRAADFCVLPLAGAEQDFGKWKSNFVREYRMLCGVSDCPAVVSVREVFEENRTAYLVMEYVEGETLEHRVRRTGPLSAQEVLEQFQDFVLALCQMHAQHILHRDINPANIILTKEGLPRLIDFGSARPDPASGWGSKALTVFVRRGFAPPEQYSRTGNQGTWTDVYGLCAVLYYALTGTAPPDAMARRAGDTMKPLSAMRPDLPRPLCSAITMGLSLEPERRPQDFARLYECLCAQQAGEIEAVQPAKAQNDAGRQCFIKRAEAARRAIGKVPGMPRGKAEVLRREIAQAEQMPYGLEAWAVLEAAVASGGRLFGLMTALCMPRER